MKSKTTEILEEEHQNILKLIGILEDEIKKIEDGEKINREFLECCIDFIRNYADKTHHAKEEDILFVEFNKNSSSSHCNPIEQMLIEHNIGRDAIRKAEKGIKEGDRNRIIGGFREYINLLREHIFKEDNILYSMCDDVLNEETKKKMLAEFNKADKKNEKDSKRCLLFLDKIKT